MSRKLLFIGTIALLACVLLVAGCVSNTPANKTTTSVDTGLHTQTMVSSSATAAAQNTTSPMATMTAVKTISTGITTQSSSTTVVTPVGFESVSSIGTIAAQATVNKTVAQK